MAAENPQFDFTGENKPIHQEVLHRGIAGMVRISVSEPTQEQRELGERALQPLRDRLGIKSTLPIEQE